MKEIVSGIFTWSWLSPNHGYNFNGYALSSADGLIVVDPANIDDSNLSELREIGNPVAILLTNKDHERISYDLRHQFGSRIFINERDVPFLKSPPDHVFKDGEMLPGGIRAINVSNNKSPGESALLYEERGILFIGDAIIGWPKGEFSLLPPVKYLDPKTAKESIRVLLDYDFDTVLVGDGESVLQGGKEAIGRFLKRQDVHLKLPVQ